MTDQTRKSEGRETESESLQESFHRVWANLPGLGCR